MKTLPCENPHLVLTQSDDGIRTIRLNNPKKRNAISRQTYYDIMKIFKDAARDEYVKILVVTGTGDYFSSGNDLGNFSSRETSSLSLEEQSEAGGEMFSAFVRCWIDFPKVLVALINGPAVGIMVTVLGLVDLAYAVDHAHFTAPFAKLGQAPEGCSTFTFPRLMGRQKTFEMFSLERRLSAFEAEKVGLITRAIPKERFQAETTEALTKLASMPFKSLLACKKMMNHAVKDRLHETNRRETEILVERWASDDCIEAVMNFMMAKMSKL